jgi:hypothetical protein
MNPMLVAILRSNNWQKLQAFKSTPAAFNHLAA